MAKIIAPNEQFTGVSASVNFVNGIGETDNPHLIGWFKEHGYTVEKAKKPPKNPEPPKGPSENTDDDPPGDTEEDEKKPEE